MPSNPNMCACGTIQYSDIPADVGHLKCDLCGVVLYDVAFAVRSSALPQRLPASEVDDWTPTRIPVVIATPLILPDVQWRIERTDVLDVRSGVWRLRYSLCCDGEELIWRDLELALSTLHLPPGFGRQTDHDVSRQLLGSLAGYVKQWERMSRGLPAVEGA